ncbi:MAG: ribosomal protein [Bacteroidetes bacterium]|nr:ribosomal protein [Bacteroidota bacterium]
MRHGDKINNLGRKSAHRKAMLSNMACSLILHKRINTTLAKAKALRTYVEPLITKSKDDSTHSRRTVFAYLGNKEAVSMLFKDVAAKVADRPGGYTRILKTGARAGDNADMCFIELVDFNENMLAAKAPAKAKTSRRGGKKKATEAKATDKTEDKKEESADDNSKSE